MRSLFLHHRHFEARLMYTVMQLINEYLTVLLVTVEAATATIDIWAAKVLSFSSGFAAAAARKLGRALYTSITHTYIHVKKHRCIYRHTIM